jgi:hypothetical protein
MYRLHDQVEKINELATTEVLGSYKNRRFGQIYRLRREGEKNYWARNNIIGNCELPDSFFPDDGDNTFLRNVGSYTSHTA